VAPKEVYHASRISQKVVRKPGKGRENTICGGDSLLRRSPKKKERGQDHTWRLKKNDAVREKKTASA